MTARRNMIFYCLTLMAVTLLLIGLASCGTDGGVTPTQATETYGAEQFHLQLTAQAQP